MMDNTKIEWVLFLLVLVALAIKLLYYFLIPKRRSKIFFKSLFKWYNPASMMEDIDDDVEAFLKVGNYCNLVIWLSGGILFYLVCYTLLFPPVE